MGRKLLTEQKERPICIRCNESYCKRNGYSILGIIKYKKYCTLCDKKVYNQAFGRKHTRKLGYSLFKRDHCENCGFVPIHSCQLDVDHVDGDKNNSDPSNLRTLCANCHRLKTYIQSKEKRKPI